MSGRFSIAHLFRGARASRVLANASSRSRTFPNAFLTDEVPHGKRLFRRNAKTNTRDVCATQKERRFARLSLRKGEATQTDLRRSKISSVG